MNVVTTVEDLVNISLTRIGKSKFIGSIYDGSQAAQIALRLYGQTRDALLKEGQWNFAERNISMDLLKQAPDGGYVPPNIWNNTFPPLPWRFEYAYPDDCLEVRSVKASPIFLMNPDPQPELFSVDNDKTYTPARKVILCNIEPEAILVYTGQITDPSNWEPDFTEAFAAALARRLAPALAGLDAAKFEAQDEAVTRQEATSGQS